MKRAHHRTMWKCRLALVTLAAGLLLPAAVLAQEKAKKPPTTTDKDRELLKELEFIDEAEVKDETVKTGLEELLETVVVTATKQKQTIAAAPAIISVITSTQIKTMGYQSVADALQSLPGFYLISDHVSWNAGVRGINGGQRASSRIIKVMIDGQPVSFRPTTGNWLGPELIPIEAVSRIEVIRGPTSALYGANAFLGVVNIITKSGALVDGAVVEGRGGLVGTKPAGGGSLVLGKKTGNMEVLLSATGSFADRSGLSAGLLPNDPSSNAQYRGVESASDTAAPASVFMKLFYQSPTLGGLSVDVSYQRKYAHGEWVDWGPLVRGRAGSGAKDYQQNLINLENLYIRSRLSRTFLDSFSVALSGAFATMGPGSKDSLALDQSGVPEYFKRDFGTTSLDLVGELSYTLKDINTFTVGVDFTADWHNLLTYYGYDLPNDPTLLQVPDITTSDNQLPLTDRLFHNFGAYFQGVIYPFQLASIRSLETLGLTVGVRYDRQNIYGDTVNYRGGLVYLWRKLSAKILYGTSYKAPAAVQLFTGRLIQVVGNEDLEPEEAQTFEIQLGGEFFPGFNATAAWFYNIIDNKVEIKPDPNLLSQSLAQNIASISGTGVEVDLGYTWRGLTSFANVSFQKSTTEEEQPLGGTLSTDVRLYPDLMAKLGLAYREPRIYLGASVEGRYIGPVRASDPNSRTNNPSSPESPYDLDGYFTLDLALFSVDLNLIRSLETFLQLKVSNITGQEYFYPGFRDFDIPALGRTMMFTLSQQL